MKTDKLKWMTDSDGIWIAARGKSEDVSALMDSFREGKEYTLEIKPYRKKRSLDANAYFWTLADKLAAKYNVAATDVYRNFIRDIGGNSEVACIKTGAVAAFCSGWERNGLGWCTDVFPSRLQGCTNVKVYYGSSTYDTAQMSRLIDLTVQECKQAGIETATPDELARMLSLWEDKRKEVQHES